MKTNIQELIESADRLCASLDRCIQNEKNLSINILIELDKINRSSEAISNNLKEIKEYVGGV